MSEPRPPAEPGGDETGPAPGPARRGASDGPSAERPDPAPTLGDHLSPALRLGLLVACVAAGCCLGGYLGFFVMSFAAPSDVVLLAATLLGTIGGAGLGLLARMGITSIGPLAGAPAVPAYGTRAIRYTRIGLAGAGLLLLLVFVQDVDRGGGGGWGMPQSFLPDEILFLLGLLAAVGLLLGLAITHTVARRRGWILGPSRWDHPVALVAAPVAFGLGVGVLAGWSVDLEGQEGVLVTTVAFTVLAVALVSERWKVGLPLLALAMIVGGLALFLRIWISGRASRWILDDVAVVSFLQMPFVVLFYVFLRRFLLAHFGEPTRVRPPAVPSLAFDLLARDGLYVVALEAPGLAAATDVRAEVTDPQRLRVRVPRVRARDDEVLFTNRPAGLLDVEVPLPTPVQEHVVGVEVDRGLVSVTLSPLRPDG